MKTLALLAAALLACFSLLTRASSTDAEPSAPGQTDSAGELVEYWTAEIDPDRTRDLSRALRNARSHIDQHYADEYSISVFEETYGSRGGTRLHWYGACKDLTSFGELKDRFGDDEDLQTIYAEISATTVGETERLTMLDSIAAGVLESPRPYRIWRTMRSTVENNPAASFAKRITDYINAKYDKAVFSTYRQMLGDAGVIHFFLDVESYADWQALDAEFSQDAQLGAYFEQVVEVFDHGETRVVLLERLF